MSGLYKSEVGVNLLDSDFCFCGSDASWDVCVVADALWGVFVFADALWDVVVVDALRDVVDFADALWDVSALLLPSSKVGISFNVFMCWNMDIL